MRYNFSLPSDKNINNYHLLAFDKDNTLTPANKPMKEKMAKYLAQMTVSDKVITILTARDFKVCKEHIIDPLSEYNFKPQNVVLGCSNGSQIFTFNPQKNDYEMSSWLVGDLEKALSPDKIEKALEILKNFFIEKEIFADVKYIHRSNTMGVFACLPRRASSEIRKNFDPDNSRRNEAIQLLREAKIFPEAYELIAGGSTSIDVGLYNKKSGMEHIIQNSKYQNQREKVIFFGDNFDGGNDSPVEEVEGIDVVRVQNPDNTLEILQDLQS